MHCIQCSLVKNLYVTKGYGPYGDSCESFLEKDGKGTDGYKLLARLRKTGTTKRKHGDGRTRTARKEWRDQNRPVVVAEGGHFKH